MAATAQKATAAHLYRLPPRRATPGHYTTFRLLDFDDVSAI